jgi:hypothetical protein
VFSTSNLVAPDVIVTDPRTNGRKIAALLAAGEGHADLYRQILAGPSGQRHNLHVARVSYVPYGSWDVSISDPRTGERAGFGARVIHDGAWWWSITAETHDGWKWMGYAETLSAGADWLIHGLYAATGRHDSRRLSQASIRTADQVHAANARKHTTECGPCRDAGQSNGWIDCVAR